MLSPRRRTESQESPIPPTSLDRIASAPEPAILGLGGMTSPDGAITLMLGDIADAHDVAQRLGPERWEQLVGSHRVLVEELVRTYRGHVARFDGDGFYASFNSAHAAIRAAVDLQQSFTDVAAATGDGTVSLRIGLHSGFVLANPDQPQGRNVVLAARIADRAHGGEILVSSALKQDTERDRSLRFESRGEHHLKGLVGEHAVYAVSHR